MKNGQEQKSVDQRGVQWQQQFTLEQVEHCGQCRWQPS